MTQETRDFYRPWPPKDNTDSRHLRAAIDGDEAGLEELPSTLTSTGSMPSISLLPPAAERAMNSISNPMPEILQTPSGLAMIELQGSVLTENADAGQVLELGNLVFPPADEDEDEDENGDWDGKRVFIFVGKHQRLAGEVKKLTKPVAIIRRRPVATHAYSSVTGSEEVEIAEIIYHKILFAHRPEPMGGEQQQQEQVDE